jgi:hypothetical protein
MRRKRCASISWAAYAFVRGVTKTNPVMLGQELKTCQKKLKDAEGDVAAAAERGRAKAKQEQVTKHIPIMVYTYT